MTIRAPLLLSVLLAGLPLAAAQENYDLRAEYKKQAGDKIRVTRHEEQQQTVVVMNQGQVAQTQDQGGGTEVVYSEELLEVDDEHEVVRATRTYDSLKDLQTGQEQPVKGLVATITRGADGVYGFILEPAEAPEALRQQLEQDMGQLGKDKDDEDNPLLPKEPVAKGASWEVPLSVVAEQFEIDPAELDGEKSKATGTLKDVVQEGGSTFYLVVIDLVMVANTFQGMTCSEPLEFRFTFTVKLSPASPAGTIEMNGTFVGTMVPADGPPGMSVKLDGKIRRNETRVRAE